MPAPNKKTLAFYRRLIYSMMDAFRGDYVMFHRYTFITFRTRIEARKKILENKDETDEVKI
jgi:hypothetical protein